MFYRILVFNSRRTTPSFLCSDVTLLDNLHIVRIALKPPERASGSLQPIQPESLKLLKVLHFTAQTDLQSAAAVLRRLLPATSLLFQSNSAALAL